MKLGAETFLLLGGPSIAAIAATIPIAVIAATIFIASIAPTNRKFQTVFPILIFS